MSATGSYLVAQFVGFAGTSVHDGWGSYFLYPCAHATCNVYLLRDLTYLAEEQGLWWAAKLKRVLLEMKEATDQLRERGKLWLDPLEVADWQARFLALLVEGDQVHPRAQASRITGDASNKAPRAICWSVCALNAQAIAHTDTQSASSSQAKDLYDLEESGRHTCPRCHKRGQTLCEDFPWAFCVETAVVMSTPSMTSISVTSKPPGKARAGFTSIFFANILPLELISASRTIYRGVRSELTSPKVGQIHEVSRFGSQT